MTDITFCPVCEEVYIPHALKDQEFCATCVNKILEKTMRNYPNYSPELDDMIIKQVIKRYKEVHKGWEEKEND